VKLAVEEDWHIVETRSEKNNAIAYRFYPDKIKGEGLFMAVVQKQEEEEVAAVKSKKVNVERISKAEEAMVKEWLNDEEALFFFRHQDSIIALPAALQADLLQLQPVLYIRKAGVRAGKIAAKSFIPDHQLALSSLISNKPVSIALNHEQAIQYLRREEVVISSGELGWAAVSFEGYYLGWVKLLSNRVNNYYPKEWRILKPF
jgi:NOL1/NOP2/fmu family ribosome biogenesis protein